MLPVVNYALQATAEDEFGIRLWDLRMLKHPLKDLPGHSHWYVDVSCSKLERKSCHRHGITHLVDKVL
jgi:hypothetical protein